MQWKVSSVYIGNLDSFLKVINIVVELQNVCLYIGTHEIFVYKWFARFYKVKDSARQKNFSV